jgi:hypothetical protein
MLSDKIRQVPSEDPVSSFEPVAELSDSMVDDLVRQGLILTEEGENDEAGPSRRG